MSTEIIRIGTIGCGVVDGRAALSIQDVEHAELAGVMDVDAGMARNLGDMHGVPWTCDVAELLARPDVDAVYVAVPNHLLAGLTIQAAQAGKHLLCEKPM